MSIMSSWSNASFKDVISLMILSLDDLPISNSGVFRSTTMIVFLSVSPSSSVSDCFYNPGLPNWEHGY